MLVMGGLAVAAAWSDSPPWLVVALAVLASVLNTPNRPAAVAATPQLVGEDDLAAANAAESIVAQAAWFVGPAVGAAVVAITDPSLAFVINAAAFAMSAALVARTGDVGGGPDPTEDAHRAADAEPGDGASLSAGALSGLTEGVRAVRTEPGLLALTLLVCALLFAFGMEQVLHVLVAVDRLGLGAEWVGVMGAAIGAGGLLVAPLTARIGRSASAGWLLVASGVWSGLPLIALSLTTSPAVVLAVLGVEGAAMIVNEVLLITMLQRACPEHLLARVYGLQESSSAVTQLLGSTLAPILVAAAGLGVGLWVGGGVAVAASILLAPAMLALAARTERDRRALRPTVDRLRRLALFTEAGEAALERLARSVVAVSVEAGTVVLHEGDAPDDLYVVESGALVVSAAGGPGGVDREVNRMGPDDSFGEIGMLQGIPRTATVVAESDCELLRIPGLVFVDSLGEPEYLPDPVRRTMTTRLARTHARTHARTRPRWMRGERPDRVSAPTRSPCQRRHGTQRRDVVQWIQNNSPPPRRPEARKQPMNEEINISNDRDLVEDAEGHAFRVGRVQPAEDTEGHALRPGR